MTWLSKVEETLEPVLDAAEKAVFDTFKAVWVKFATDEGQLLLKYAKEAVDAAELALEKDGLQKFAQAEGDILARLAADEIALAKADIAFAIELFVQNLRANV